MTRVRLAVQAALLGVLSLNEAFAQAPPLLGSWPVPDPNALAVAPSGDVYVCGGVSQVLHFSSSGTLLGSWGSYGQGPGEFEYNPNGIAVAPDGSVYVADEFNSRIQQFTPAGVFVRMWGTRGTGDSQLLGPRGISVATNGHVFVTDWALCRVQEFTAVGEFVRVFGGCGYNLGQLSLPSDVVVTTGGEIVVAEDGNTRRLQRFDSGGAALATLEVVYPDLPRMSAQPYGVAVLPSGNLVLTDYSFSRVAEISLDGTLVRWWGSPGSGPGQFHGPLGIATSSDGTIYVADLQNNRIQVYGPMPTPVHRASWGELKSRFR